MSVLDFGSIGSSLSLRSFCRMGSSFSISGTINLNSDLRITSSSAKISAMSSGGTVTQRITMPQSGNAVLHGTWFADNAVDSSDRRLKENIAPLGIHLEKRRGFVRGASGATSSDSTEDSAVSWVLRELRPVSFSFKAGVDAKSLPREQRFGFVAQEVERVTPSLVYNSQGDTAGDTPLGTLSLLYQDLLAVLTLAFKEQQTQLARQDADVSLAQQEVTDLLEAAETLEQVLDSFEAAAGAVAIGDNRS
jgi:hypothetical protein